MKPVDICDEERFDGVMERPADDSSKCFSSVTDC